MCYKKGSNGTKTAKRRNGTAFKTKKTNTLNLFNPKKSIQMYTGRYVIQIFIAENISVQVLLRHACSIFEELKK